MPELMGLPIDAITFEDVQAFCARQTPENIRLEYKAQFSSKPCGAQIAKEAAAFANTQGGTILFGVEEESGRRPVKTPNGADLGGNPKATIQSACAHIVFPPIVPEVSDFIRNPADREKGFVLVRVGASEDIHTIDGGTGIYIRVNDQSEPVQASLDRIEWMLQRRGHAVSIQAERRARIIRTLQGVTSTSAGAGGVEVTIGPKIVIDPLIDLAQLRDNVNDFCVKSQYHNWDSFPIADQHRASSMADGIYCDNRHTGGFGDSAGAIDVFGNLALRTFLLHEQKFGGPMTTDEERSRIPRVDGETVGVEAAAAVERILCITQAARCFYSATGFVGIVELCICAPNATEYPLTWFGGRWSRVMGFCAPANEIVVRSTVSTTDLAEDHSAALQDFVLRFLWSWGCMERDAPSKVIECAERYFYGAAQTSVIQRADR